MKIDVFADGAEGFLCVHEHSRLVFDQCRLAKPASVSFGCDITIWSERDLREIRFFTAPSNNVSGRRSARDGTDLPVSQLTIDVLTVQFCRMRNAGDETDVLVSPQPTASVSEECEIRGTNHIFSFVAILACDRSE